jgi:hypothetical protein
MFFFLAFNMELYLSGVHSCCNELDVYALQNPCVEAPVQTKRMNYVPQRHSGTG